MKRKLEEASFVEKQNEDVLFSGKADSKTLATVGEKASTSLLGSPISDEEVAPARGEVIALTPKCEMYGSQSPAIASRYFHRPWRPRLCLATAIFTILF